MGFIINITNNYKNIFQDENIFSFGNLFIGDHLFSEVRLLADLKEITTVEQLEDKLDHYNGFFAFIVNCGDELFAAVDPIRSIPIFYGLDIDNNFYISNDAEWVRLKVVDEKMDQMAKQEFLLTGYVTGQDTLFEKVKQLQAGEYLYLNNNNDIINITTKRYYRFLHKEPKAPSEFGLYQRELDEVMNNTIRRLIAYVNGRQIVIPLSAGRDSRLIALKLKQLGYKNVLCFSYGIKGNFEAETSKRVANLLGFQWEYIEYTEELWKQKFNTNERKEYFKRAFNWVSLPVVQDWLAVWELKNRGVFELNAVFVPGHSGDFPAGSHLPFDAIPDKKASIMDLVYSMQRSHYSLMASHEVKKQIKFWRNRIINTCEIKCIVDGYDYADAFEKWDWQERQAKFIVNSVRVYEFWNFDWWLPFWDKDFMFYWQAIPLKFRKNKILYNTYVDNLYTLITKDKDEIQAEKKINGKINCWLLLKQFGLYHFIVAMNKRIKKKLRIIPNQNDTNSLYGVFSENFKKEYINQVSGINGLLAIFVLNELNGKNNKH
jgi:asparagine synthase (glutamine-hydrolysing)